MVPRQVLDTFRKQQPGLVGKSLLIVSPGRDGLGETASCCTMTVVLPGRCFCRRIAISWSRRETLEIELDHVATPQSIANAAKAFVSVKRDGFSGGFHLRDTNECACAACGQAALTGPPGLCVGVGPLGNKASDIGLCGPQESRSAARSRVHDVRRDRLGARASDTASRPARAAGSRYGFGQPRPARSSRRCRLLRDAAARVARRNHSPFSFTSAAVPPKRCL